MPTPNLSFIDELSGSDGQFRMKLINIVKTELQGEITIYMECFMENTDKAAAIVHKLKHKISILGMSESYQIATDYEEVLREGRWDGHEKFDEILNKMSEFIAEL